jgi:membrane fusion protein (multidrug efflux system)
MNDSSSMRRSQSNGISRGLLRRRMAIMLIACAVIFGGIFGWQAFGSYMMRKGMASAPMPTQTVSAARAEFQEWQPRVRAVGTLRAAKGTDVSAEVPGIVEEIRFESGDDVKAGQVLLNLRAGVDAARLREAQAAAALAQSDFQRNQELFQKNLVSKAALDAAAAQMRSTEAQVSAQREGVRRTAVRAPFGGRIGLRVVDVGEYLNAGTKIATLQSLDAIFADFWLPQRELGQLSAGRRVTVTTDSFPGEAFTGQVTAIDPQVDLQTHNVAVRAAVDNSSGKLLPGMYVSVEVDAGEPQRYITLPQTAVVYNSFGETVFVVREEAGNTAEAGQPAAPAGPRLVARQAFVKVGPTRGDQVAILSGIGEGAMVVTAGQIKLQDGMPLKINNAVQPPNDPNPRPPDEPTQARPPGGTTPTAPDESTEAARNDPAPRPPGEPTGAK